MPDPVRPSLYSVPYGVDLCDATVNAIFDGVGRDPLALSEAVIFVPNNRAISAMTEAFVRAMRPGLLLPRIVAIGDLHLDDALGPMLDPLEGASNIAPVITPMRRMMLLTRLITENAKGKANPVSANEALRLARYLSNVIDEFEIEEISFREFSDIAVEPDLASHWQDAYGQLLDLIPRYYAELKKLDLCGPSARRNQLLDQLTARLKDVPPTKLMIAAGISTAAPAISRLLRQIALLPNSKIIFPCVDLTMSDTDWDALGPHDDDPETGFANPSHATHPQFHLKLLLNQMGFARGEITVLGNVGDGRGDVISQIFCLPVATSHWRSLPDTRKQMPHVRLMLADDIALEARSIAILLRGAVERPGIRAALATPDRELAVRVAAQLTRWGIAVDDSAGKPMVQSTESMLIMAVAQAIADRFSPVSLLAIAKHPLVQKGDGRLIWLEQVRQLDMILRGPNMGIGLTAISNRIRDYFLGRDGRGSPKTPEFEHYWDQFTQMLGPVSKWSGGDFSDILELIVNCVDELTNSSIWKGSSGRQLSIFLEELSSSNMVAIGKVARDEIPAILTELFNGQVVRPQYGSHPRIAIYGLLEARFQQADILICGGLNEGSWPQLPAPDPWLAPRIRRHLKMASLDRNIGLSAHDLATALGNGEVILSRSRHDVGGPTVASRFLLRIQAMLGDNLVVDDDTPQFAREIDMPAHFETFDKPAPMPKAAQRKVDLSVTDFDKLKSDPFSFYAQKIMRLRLLEAVDAEPSFAWRGTVIHDVLQRWADEDHCVPEKLLERAQMLLTNPALHPTLRTLWQPRITAGLQWVAEETARLEQEQGRKLIAAEVPGHIDLEGVRIKGRADRIDRLADGGLVIIDYKSGQPPKDMQVYAGYALQLGLIALMAQNGEMKHVSGVAELFEYWSLAKRPKGGGFGIIKNPTSQTGSDRKHAHSEFVPFIREMARQALDNWIIGDAPFTAKLHPEYGNYTDYDQLMRLQEWDGREPINRAGTPE